MRLIFYLLFLTINLSAQVTDVKHLFNDLTITSWVYPNGGNMFTEDGQRVGSDTTEVIYVVIEEDFYEQVEGNQVDTIYYPTLKSFYGYHVQNWKPYNVVFYDLNWNVIHDPIHIKKRKLKSKQ